VSIISIEVKVGVAVCIIIGFFAVALSDIFSRAEANDAADAGPRVELVP
jgi:hypothetical protein